MQNSLVRITVALAQIANECLCPADKNQGPNITYILDRAMVGIRCGAYGVQRCNTFRKFLLRPHLNSIFQCLCDEQVTQLALLLPPDLSTHIKNIVEKSKNTFALTKQGAKLGKKKRRGGKARGQGGNGSQRRHNWGPGQQLNRQPAPPQYQQQFYPQQGKFFHYSTKPAFRNTQSQKFTTKHSSWLKFYENIHKNQKTTKQKINMIELQEMIMNSISTARSQKLQVIPYNYNIESFSFSTESQPEGYRPRSAQQGPSVQQRGSWPRSSAQLDAQCNTTQVFNDPLHIPDLIQFIDAPFQAGSLKSKIHVWRKITNDPELISLISGVSLSFSSPPFQEKLPHEIIFSGGFKSKVEIELNKFLDQGIIEHSTFSEGDYLSNLFARPKKSPGEIRLILNLKKLNLFVPSTHFKMETLDLALKLIRPNMFMTSIDLTNSFYHLLVKPQYRKFLKFTSLGTTYQFTSLPMGYKESPRLFTKLMKAPLAWLRKHYHCILVCYMDDLLIFGYTREEAIRSTAFVANLLQMLGFFINWEKSEIDPKQCIEFLGFILNSVDMTVSLTRTKMTKIQNLAKSLLKQNSFTIRFLAQFLGNCVASFPAMEFGPYHTKELEMEKVRALNANGWDFEGFMSLSEWSRPHVQWWAENAFQAKISLVAPPNSHQIHLFSDASKLGWGAFFPSTNSSTGGLWSPSEQLLHVNVLELKAIWFAVTIFLADFHHQTVHLHTDNQVSLFCLKQQGSTRSPWCNKYTAKIMQFFQDHSLHLVVSYVRSEENTQADLASRVYEFDLEWSIPMDIFQIICNIWGVPEIDLFASRLNHRVSTYCSWKPDPFAYAIDAFSLDWNHFNLIYVYAPFSLIPRVLKHYQEQEDSAEAIIVVPQWPSQPWWPLLVQLLIDIPRKMDSSKLILHNDPAKRHKLQFTLLLCKISQNNIKIKGFQKRLLKQYWQVGHRKHISNTSPTGTDGFHTALEWVLTQSDPL